MQIYWMRLKQEEACLGEIIICTLLANHLIYPSSSPPANVHHDNQFLPCEQIPKGLSDGICFPKLRAC